MNRVLDFLTWNKIVPGLPEGLFLIGTYFFPQVNVELVIYIKDHGFLYAWREDSFENVGWHLLGGIVRPRETTKERIRRTIESECEYLIGYDLSEELIGYSEVMGRRKAIRSHFISLVFRIDLKVASQCVKDIKSSDKRFLITEMAPINLIKNHDRYRALLDVERTGLIRF